MPDRPVAIVRVYHGLYGCETGCCGHWVEIPGVADPVFTWGHQERENAITFAREHLREALAECDNPTALDWEHAEIDISEVCTLKDCPY